MLYITLLQKKNRHIFHHILTISRTYLQDLCSQASLHHGFLLAIVSEYFHNDGGVDVSLPSIGDVLVPRIRLYFSNMCCMDQFLATLGEFMSFKIVIVTLKI